MPLIPEAQAGPSVSPALWCAICEIGRKHATDNYHLLPKYMHNSQQLFYNFYRSVGHGERTCRSYELMMDRKPTYKVQAEMRALDQNAGMVRTGFQGRRRGRGGWGPGRGSRQLICYNCEGLGHYACDCRNLMQPSCLYCTLFDHEIEDCPTLIARLHNKEVLQPPLT